MTKAVDLAKTGSLVNSSGQVPLDTGVSGTLPVANGGTGATTQAGAAAAVLPTQTGNSGKYLTTDGANSSWATVTQTTFSAGTTGFTPNTATSGTVTLAGTLNVANGGTGATTLSANAVLLGNGTSALQAVAPSTSGNVLTSNGTSWVSSSIPAPTIADGSVTAPKFNSFTASSTFCLVTTNTLAATSLTTSPAIKYESRFFRNGTFRVKADIYTYNDYPATVTFYARIYRNGSAVGNTYSVSRTEGTNGTATGVSLGDITFATGDLFQIYMWSSVNSSSVGIYFTRMWIGTAESPATMYLSNFNSGSL